MAGLPARLDNLRSAEKEQKRLTEHRKTVCTQLRAEKTGTDQHRKLVKILSDVEEMMYDYR